MLLIVDDPDAAIERAVAAGATLVRPAADEHGWRLGRIADPFGHHWEIGKPLRPWPPRALVEVVRLEPGKRRQPVGGVDELVEVEQQRLAFGVVRGGALERVVARAQVRHRRRRRTRGTPFAPARTVVSTVASSSSTPVASGASAGTGRRFGSSWASSRSTCAAWTNRRAAASIPWLCSASIRRVAGSASDRATVASAAVRAIRASRLSTRISPSSGRWPSTIAFRVARTYARWASTRLARELRAELSDHVGHSA